MQNENPSQHNAEILKGYSLISNEEPTDEQLEALMEEVLAEVILRAQKAYQA